MCRILPAVLFTLLSSPVDLLCLLVDSCSSLCLAVREKGYVDVDYLIDYTDSLAEEFEELCLMIERTLRGRPRVIKGLSGVRVPLVVMGVGWRDLVVLWGCWKWWMWSKWWGSGSSNDFQKEMTLQFSHLVTKGWEHLNNRTIGIVAGW